MARPRSKKPVKSTLRYMKYQERMKAKWKAIASWPPPPQRKKRA